MAELVAEAIDGGIVDKIGSGIVGGIVGGIGDRIGGGIVGVIGGRIGGGSNRWRNWWRNLLGLSNENGYVGFGYLLSCTL